VDFLFQVLNGFSSLGLFECSRSGYASFFLFLQCCKTALFCFFAFTLLAFFFGSSFVGFVFRLLSSFLLAGSFTFSMLLSVLLVFAVAGFASKSGGQLFFGCVISECVLVAQQEFFSTQASVAIHVRNGFPGIFLITCMLFGSEFSLLAGCLSFTTSFCCGFAKLASLLICSKRFTFNFGQPLVAFIEDLFEVIAQLFLGGRIILRLGDRGFVRKIRHFGQRRC